MKATVTEDAAGLRWQIKDDGSEDYRKAVELTCLKPAAWIPVGERLPDRYIRVLAFVKCEPHEHPHAIGFVGSTGLWSLDELHEPSAEITHWMPLPEPPEVK